MGKEKYPPLSGFPNPWPSAYQSLTDYDKDLGRQLEVVRQEIKEGFRVVYESNPWVLKAGDTMTGSLTLSAGAIAVNAGNITIGNGAATDAYELILNDGSTGANGGVIRSKAAGSNEWLLCTARGAGDAAGTLGMAAYVFGSNPFQVWINSTKQVQFDAGVMTLQVTGYIIKADFSNASETNRARFQSSTTNGFTGVPAIPNGTSQIAAFQAFNSSSFTNCAFVDIRITGSLAQITSGTIGSGTGLPMSFSVAGSERARIETTGVFSLVSGQMKFPATQIPSTDANTLDDYEEGTFTPTIGGTLTNGTYTYTTQVGRYVKIGGLVIFNLEITINAISAAATGNIVIRGLPFASNNNFGGAHVPWANGFNTAPMGGLVANTDSHVSMYKLASAVTYNRAAWLPADLAAAADIHISGHYYAA